MATLLIWFSFSLLAFVAVAESLEHFADVAVDLVDGHARPVTGAWQTTVRDADVNVMLVHLGRPDNVPYLKDAVEQLRLFYNGSIYLYSDYEPVTESWRSMLVEFRVKLVLASEIPRSPSHQLYLQENVWSNVAFRDHFWLKCSQRFFAIDDLMRHFALRNVIHIENDVMIYRHLDDIVRQLAQSDYDMGGTFANEQWVIPGLLFIRDHSVTESLVEFIARNRQVSMNDMQMLALFSRSGMLKPLPVVSQSHECPAPEELYCPEILNGDYEFLEQNNGETVMFDAAALGQLIGGVDPRNIKGDTRGFVNTDTVYRFNDETVEWRQIEAPYHESKVIVPYVNDVRVVNLHIHSKDLKRWSSLYIKHADLIIN